MARAGQLAEGVRCRAGGCRGLAQHCTRGWGELRAQNGQGWKQTACQRQAPLPAPSLPTPPPASHTPVPALDVAELFGADVGAKAGLRKERGGGHRLIGRCIACASQAWHARRDACTTGLPLLRSPTLGARAHLRHHVSLWSCQLQRQLVSHDGGVAGGCSGWLKGVGDVRGGACGRRQGQEAVRRRKRHTCRCLPRRIHKLTHAQHSSTLSYCPAAARRSHPLPCRRVPMFAKGPACTSTGVCSSVCISVGWMASCNTSKGAVPATSRQQAVV